VNERDLDVAVAVGPLLDDRQGGQDPFGGGEVLFSGAGWLWCAVHGPEQNDDNDARSAAVAALRARELPGRSERVRCENRRGSKLCPLRGVISLRTVGVRSYDDPARHAQRARTGRGAPPREPKESAVADKSPRQSSSKKSGKTLKQKRADKKAAAASKDTRVHIPTRGPAK